ncbi:unnamed protein product [Cochlearia groenlandica]
MRLPKFEAAPILIWWDIENCSCPSSFNSLLFEERVTSTLCKDGYGGKIKIRIITVIPLHATINQAEMKNVHFNNIEGHAADCAIQSEIREWIETDFSPSNVMLITGD